jgi:RND family efflux transporter MFP subunit
MKKNGLRIPMGVAAFVALVVVLVVGLVLRSGARGNKVALASTPKPVTVVLAKAATYRDARGYVGTLEPWVEANVGPQLASGFVDTVLVRPGAVVRRGDVLATLDCRNASAASQAVAMQARALDARQTAISHEATRVQGLLDGGFVSENEAEQKVAQSAEQEAQLLATRSKLMATSLEVNDCVLRAPFDGEVATRVVDPGAFVRPGTPMISIVDRAVLRITGDAPEVDFAAVAPLTPVRIRLLATGRKLEAPITRRAPSADPRTRTVRFEIDVPDPTRSLPVGTTAELSIDAGQPKDAVQLPLAATSIRNGKATVFVVEGGVAHTKSVSVIGESAGIIYLDAKELAPGARVITEGRNLLTDGEAVDAREAKP